LQILGDGFLGNDDFASTEADTAEPYLPGAS
jgi:hypothetical protein